MKKTILSLIMTCCLSGLYAQQSDSPLWMRNSQISPSGKEVCFTYKGDIFIIGINGDTARQLTTNAAYDSNPIWSNDGSKIAFSSDRYRGGTDVYIVNKEGGVAKRLTTHSDSEIPIAFKDDTTLLFKANVMPSISDVQFPSSTYSQVYEVSINGGRAKMFSSMPMEAISFNSNGDKIYYHDKKGYEDSFRKHHISSITRDVWSADISDGKISNYIQLTSFRGEDRTPVIGSNQSILYYTSEMDSTINVYKMDLSNNKTSQITFHKEHPVRSLSISNNDILCYSWNGELYTLDATKQSSKPQKLAVNILTDTSDKGEIKSVIRSGSGQIALSPNQKEIAFIYHGDIYVTSTEYSTTKQITNTTCEERNVSFSPDGRSLVYCAERDGNWQIFQTSITRKEDQSFAYATEIEEEQLTNSNITSIQPLYSPDGKEVAFLEERTAIKVLNLKSKKVREVMNKCYEYSYSDGDQSYSWSPDSKWILSGYNGIGGWNSGDIALIKADGSGEIHNLTESGYSDNRAKWVLDGEAIIWFSDRAGYRSHGSWGAQTDVYAMFFTAEAYEKFKMNKEELALLAEKEKENTKESKKDKEKEEADQEEGKEKDKKVEDLEFDLENVKNRIVRLTGNSANIADAVLSKDGTKLYYLASFEGGYDLWMREFATGSTTLRMKNVGGGGLIVAKNGTDIYMNSGGIKKIDLNSNKTTNISFESTFTHRPEQEREYMFNHVWQQINDKFYVEELHGVDWESYRDNYAQMLSHINNNSDFAELLSELLGELNASHTGARYYPSNSSLPTASLGVFFDESYNGDGLKIAEIIAGSPLDITKTDVKVGDIIEKIDGIEITKGMDYFPLLEGKVNKNVTLTVSGKGHKKGYEQQVKLISQSAVSTLLYKRWVKSRFDIVDSISNGTLGYVHIKAMDSNSYRELYSELLGKFRNREAVIIDTRHNGGGWLHDDVITLLSGEKYQDFVAHGQFIGHDPYNKWVKPSCMLVCEDNYSNAHGTPWLYKELEVGKLIGTPVPGTMTAVWWKRLIDSSLLFGIPQVGIVDNRGQYAENNELQPDILIYNSPEKSLNGQDEQLLKAIEYMMSSNE
ncbi:MAG: S41 family peptidase [Rikenellaceae bacterium]